MQFKVKPAYSLPKSQPFFDFIVVKRGGSIEPHSGEMSGAAISISTTLLKMNTKPMETIKVEVAEESN